MGSIIPRTLAMYGKDNELQDVMIDILNSYPMLQVVIPRSFIKRVTLMRMQEYADRRLRRYFHLLNFPMALHESIYSESEDVRTLMSSLLASFEDFLRTFGHLPGAKSLLRPLWQNPWDDAPEIWSIASCTHLAIRAASCGIRLLGFERPIGSGMRDADMTLQTAMGIVQVDVETWHSAQFAGRSDNDIRAALERRAMTKARQKFSCLCSGHTGLIAEVVVIAEADVGRHLVGFGSPRPLAGMLDMFWMPLRLVGVRGRSLRFGLDHL